jgi:methionine synthase II (cobalamin-independent)
VHTTTTHRADHVSSLLRPPDLLRARDEHAQGRLTRDALRTLEDEAILRALEMQKQTGIAVLSDGEYRRATWSDAWTHVLQPFMVELERPTTRRCPAGAGMSTL